MDSSPPKSGKTGIFPVMTSSPKARSASPDVAFDLWLQRGLQQVFASVAQEPIPDDILALINNAPKT